MPSELPLLGKTLLSLHEIGLILAPEFDVNASMRQNATSLMRRHMLKSLTPTHLMSSALEVRDFAERLPERVNRILESLAANDLRLKIEVIDHGSIIDGFQKVANRIALGVVLAALIVGAAMLMRVQTSFTILGYPGLRDGAVPCGRRRRILDGVDDPRGGRQGQDKKLTSAVRYLAQHRRAIPRDLTHTICSDTIAPSLRESDGFAYGQENAIDEAAAATRAAGEQQLMQQQPMQQFQQQAPLDSSPSSGGSPPPPHLPSQPSPPTHRPLRGYAFDPSLATKLETALVSEITYKVPWEPLDPGPIGKYVEVVDFDPPTGCFYAPVNLDDPAVLAQQGLTPSEGNPQFHQQMVYAAAMTTIDRFEQSLGRKAFWTDRFERGSVEGADQFVERLRIYPHALRMANAYYSRNRGSLLFGYFPATDDRTSGQFPGGMVFTCLSHDIVAHETTHALLDGFHEYFMEATNPDVLAFHEGFADIVALFQHFTFPEVLVHQIAKTRGDLSGSENLLAQLATQFGHARGTHGALRDAIGRYDPVLKKWVKHEPDPFELDETLEVHARGAIFVAAVFDAFLSIYHNRTRDLLRLASGGTGLVQGELHPDLVNRLAQEASKAASHVLSMCIRALDYCPPVDLTFGEYLRALITADMDLMPEDEQRYRVAFIEAFRRRGIYPRDVRTLSEDSLRWTRPGEDPTLAPGQMKADVRTVRRGDRLAPSGGSPPLQADPPGHLGGNALHPHRSAFRDSEPLGKADLLQRLTGLALTTFDVPEGVKVHRDGAPVFTVKAFREADASRGMARSSTRCSSRCCSPSAWSTRVSSIRFAAAAHW